MNILHISTPMSWRGGEQQLAYLALELRRLGVEEQIFLCAPGGAVEEFCFAEEFTAFPYSPSIFQLLANAGLIRRICRNYKIDVIHTHDSKGHTLAFVAGVLGNRTPIVVSRRVDFPVGKSWLSRRKYNSKHVKRILCVSEAIRRITGASIEDKSVLRVVYDGVDTQIPADEIHSGLREELGIGPGVRIVGNVAALAPHKDYFTWLDAAEQMLKQDANLQFVAVGDGPTRPEIEAYLAQKNLGDKVKLLGFRKDAKALLAQFDVFMMSSETEGLGTSILDAFVRGVPVAATAAGGIPEIVQDGISGLLAPPKDAATLAAQALRILNDPALAHQLSANAREHVKQFDKSVMAEKTLAEYREVVSER